MGNHTYKSELKDTRRGVTLCARSMGLDLFYGCRSCPPPGLGEEGSRHKRRVVGAGSRRRRRFCLAQPVRFRGLKNKPKFRCFASFTPKFSLLFHRSKGRARRVFRALRSATGVSTPAPDKLLKKFDQNFQKRVLLNLQTPIYRSLIPPTTENFLLFYILFKKISHNG